MTSLPKVKPYVVPKATAPYRQTLKLDDAERQYFDLIAQEHTRIAGTTMEYWQIDVPRSKRDALYDEPKLRKYDGPFKITGWLQFPDASTSTGEEGYRVEWNCTAWIARKELEDAGAQGCSEGDVIRVWDIPFFKDFKIPGSGYYFDVLQVTDDGHINDTASFVGFKLVLKRRTEAAPERKIFPEDKNLDADGNVKCP